MSSEMADLLRLRPPSEWHEDIGPVLWWLLDESMGVCEPPFHVGTPLDDDWPWESGAVVTSCYGRLAYWSPLPQPRIVP